MKDKIQMDQGKALNQIKKEKKIDKELRDGKRMESVKDPVDTITAMQDGESSIKKEL